MNSTQNNNNISSESIKCIVRCRPMNSKEKNIGIKCISINNDSKCISLLNKDGKTYHNKAQYIMDKVFSENISQQEIFKEIGEPTLESFLDGYNCTIFCYGQTGAGKTYTMLGPLDQLFEESSSSHGLIPRIIHFLFNEKNRVINLITNNTTGKCKNISYQLKLCVMEIYQEQIIDLLNPIQDSNPDFNLYSTNNNIKKDTNELKIKEDPKKGMYIQGITEEIIENVNQAKNIILTGLKSRHVACTEMNAESSRSHLLFSIYLNAEYMNSKNTKIQKNSRLHLIDLAGSERQKKTKIEGNRIKEACMINKSLSILGNVIYALVEVNQGKGKYVPFRDSKLTYFLKDSLGGNSKTTIVANISPSLMQVVETISTLKFAQRAKLIKNSAILNVSEQENIETLHEEIKRLKAIIEKGGYYDLNASDDDYNNYIKNKNVTKEEYICPFCHNQPNKINQQNDIKELKNDIINLSNSIVSNLNLGEELKTLLINVDKDIEYKGLNYFDLLELYKLIYNNDHLNKLCEKIKLLNKFYEEVKDDITSLNKKIKEYKPSNPIDSLIFEKINNINIIISEIIAKFKECDIERLNKLKIENENIKEEIGISKEIKSNLELQNKEKNSKKSKEKETIITKVIDKFVKSNDDIKNFMEQHFLGHPILKNELIFLEKSKYDLLKFQLDEEKMMNNSLKKQIEDMESENYLINLELSKMKDQFNKFKNFKSSGKLNTIRRMEDDTSYISPSKNNIIQIYNEKLLLDNITNYENINNDNFSSEITGVNTVKVRVPISEKKNSVQNKVTSEIIKIKENLEDSNEDLEEKTIYNDELNEKIEQLEEEINKLNINLEIEKRNNEESKEELESMTTQIEFYENKIEDFLKFKNYIETIIEELSTENNKLNLLLASSNFCLNEILDTYNNKCFQLFNQNKNYYLQIQSLKEDIKSKEDIIKIIDNKCKIYSKYLEINDIEIEEISKLLEDNGNKINDFHKWNINYLEKIILFFNNFIKKNENIINEIFKLFYTNDNKMDKCFNEFNNILNKVIVKIQREEKIIKTLNNELVLLKKDISEKNRILETHFEFEININKDINEMSNQLSNINNLIIQLNEKYNNDLSKLNYYYNNIILVQKQKSFKFINNNNNDINEIINMIITNNNKMNLLKKNYEELNSIFYNKCCSLLNRNKILFNENIKLKENNSLFIKNIKNLESQNQLNINNNNKLKIINEEYKEQINKLNIKIKEYQRENSILNNNLISKIELIKELEKNINENNSKIIELNERISLFNKEISNKNELKSDLLKQLKQKEFEIQKYEKEMQNKVLNMNNKYKVLLKSKEDNIFELNKKLKLQGNQILYLNKKNWNFNTNYFGLEKFSEKDINFNLFKFENDKLKEFNNSLFKEKLILEENQIKLNMKYNVTKTIMNLGIQLKNEFYTYKSDNCKENGNMDDIINSFINMKIEKCNEDKKIIQKKIGQKLIEKKNLNIQLLDQIKIYKEKFISIFNNNITNLKDSLKILKENEEIDNGKESKSLSQIIQEIIEKYNEYSILENNLNSKYKNHGLGNINVIINQIKEIITNIKSICNNKKDIIDNIIPKILKLMNILQKIELNIDNNIKYNEYKKQILEEKESNIKNDIFKLSEEYQNFKEILTNIKDKLFELYESFLLFGEKLDNDEYNYNYQIERGLTYDDLLKIHKENNINNNPLEEANYEQDEGSKKIIHEINNLKDEILNKINFLSDICNKAGYNKYSDILNKFKNFYLIKDNLSENEKSINEIINEINNLDKDINNLKNDFLILNILPEQYFLNKVFITNDILICKIKKLEEKLKLIFGKNFEIKNIYINNKAPEIIWNKSEIPKLVKEIMLLKEEKNKIEQDLNSLKLNFDSVLKEKGKNNQVTILFQIKEENKNLRKEIQQIKQKNKIIQEKLKVFNRYNFDNEIFLYEDVNKNLFLENLNLSNSSMNDSSLNQNNNINQIYEHSSIINYKIDKQTLQKK